MIESIIVDYQRSCVRLIGQAELRGISKGVFLVTMVKISSMSKAGYSTFLLKSLVTSEQAVGRGY